MRPSGPDVGDTAKSQFSIGFDTDIACNGFVFLPVFGANIYEKVDGGDPIEWYKYIQANPERVKLKIRYSS